MKRRRHPGFSLIEVMIAIVIVGLLAALAYPAYQEYLREGRRTDAIDTLLALQLAQANWRTGHGVYTGNLADLGWTSGDSREGHYTLQITNATAYAFTATAMPKVGGLQVADNCSFSINQDGPVLASDTDRRCWRKR